jgi:hypothetical protein
MAQVKQFAGGQSPYAAIVGASALPAECCALSMMTKSADRPTSIRPQSRLGGPATNVCYMALK